MQNEILKIGTELHSDTVYVFDGPRCDIFPDDTKRITDESCLSVCDSSRGYLDTAFCLNGLKNVTLDFCGRTLFLHGRIQPFIIDRCENITIRNAVVEYDRSFYTEFDVIAGEEGRLRLARKAKFPCRVENGYLIPYADTWEKRDLNRGDMFIQTYDTQSGEGTGAAVVVIGEKIIRTPTPPCEVNELRVREENGEVVLYGKLPPEWGYGMTAVLSHEPRDKSSVMVCRSRNVRIENYRILNGAGMGIVGMYSENLTLDGLKLFRDERSHGIVTNAADAVHLAACRGEINIENSVLEGMTDDALNVHTNFHLVSKAAGNIIAAYKDPASHCLPAAFQKFGAGDRIAVYRGATLEPRAEFTLSSVKLTGKWSFDLAADRGAEAEGVLPGDIIENLSTQPRLTLRGCRFGKANSHLRIQTRGKSVMENCVCGLPVLLTGDLSYWYEASPVNDLTIRGCTFRTAQGCILAFSECHPTSAAPYYHRGIKVENNVFECETALSAESADDIVFRGNRRAGGGELALRLKSCGLSKTEGCGVIRS